MSAKLPDGSWPADPRLGRVAEFDPRSRGYPVRELLTARQAVTPRSYTWSVPVRLNQGSEGACVGFSIAQEAAARPVRVPGVTNEDGLAVYRRAQQLDEWPGESYSGSSVLAGMKAATEQGWYSAYHWAFSLEELALAVGHRGPAVVGINWYSEMMDVDAEGFVRVGGYVAGGHAILVNGVSHRLRRFRLTNSWGPSWGWDGQAWISFADMALLLAQSGEACVPVTRTGG